MGELTEIQLYDIERTLKVVQNTKIKPFAKLRKLPANRNKYWKEAYGLACKDIDGQKVLLIDENGFNLVYIFLNYTILRFDV